MTKHARLCASVCINDGASLSSASAGARRDLFNVCVCVCTYVFLTGCVSEPPSLPKLFKPHKQKEILFIRTEAPIVFFTPLCCWAFYFIWLQLQYSLSPSGT